MTQVNESILNKIKNMLAKAAPDSGASEAEAQSCLLMAQKWMAKYNIEMSQVMDTATDKARKEIEHGKVTAPERKVWWKGRLAMIVAENFRCHSYYSKYGRGLKSLVELRFLGKREDVEIASEVFHAAAAMIDYYSKEYLKARKKAAQKKAGVDFKRMTLSDLEDFAIEQAGMYRFQVRDVEQKYGDNPEIYKMRLIMAIKDAMGISINPTALMNTYIDGFLDGLERKFKEQVQADKSLALVLVRDADVDKALADLNLKNGSASSAKSLRDRDAHTAGFRQGKSFAGPAKGKLNEGQRRIKS
jgi:hypothetical protein